MKTPSQNKSGKRTGPSQAASYIELEETSAPQLCEPIAHYARLDPAAHGRIICEQLTPEEEVMANDPNVKPFAHVSDSAAYVRRIRRDFRC
ncbi:hypothetical protein SAMN05216327_11110 [Dyadobacter sp. SG02]|uniref:hypothetical protein n=1 Tax=Dyadobacter sp. SG02 TaxID=1855291 RepID=UPI0008AEDE1F|nr:hypothetical protein [Dyadobacter sp. SG02]SEJ47278.1 hypothetical protein SAMN05216327_11110 [Dyadobacter sp. SG02]